MASSRCVPLPLPESVASPVVIYFYNGSWIPVIHYSLAEAIALYYKGQSEGQALLAFPPNLDPNAEVEWNDSSVTGQVPIALSVLPIAPRIVAA